MKQAVLYARVSSKEQEQSGFSIPAQIKFLNDYARKEGFEVVKIFSESMTAKEEGRNEFNAMLKFLRQHKNIHHILVEKNDRLLRNESDMTTVIKTAQSSNINFHLVKDCMILNKQSKPQDFLIFTIFSAVSAMMPRNLSGEVLKGMTEKCEEGFYPGRAPIGYKNIRLSKKQGIIVVDDENAPFIKKIYELYATGAYSFKSLAIKMNELGFTPYKKPCSKMIIEKIFNNPFYMGEFEWNGKRYFDTRHQPLISKELFYAVQEQRRATGSPRIIKHDFIYTNMIKCSICGCYLTAEIKKSKYIYYHCTGNKGGDCKKKYLKQEHIDEFVSDTLKGLYVSPECIKLILDIIKIMYKEKNEFEENSLEQIEKQIKLYRTRLNKLYIDKLDGVIDEGFYHDRKEDWQIELDKLEIKRQTVLQGDSVFIKNAENLLELCKNAYNYYLKQNNEQKREMLNLLCSNFSYDGENLDMELKSTFEPMFKSAILINGGG